VGAGPGANRYRDAAAQVAEWLDFVAVEDLGGLTWPAQPTLSSMVEPSLGWGALGPMVFFADSYRSGGGDFSRQRAERGAQWLRAKLALVDPEMETGLFTGLAGFAVVFNEMARAGIEVQSDLARVFELLRESAVESGSGVQWAETTEVLWGTAGIGFLLLSIGSRVIGEEALELAARAGDWLLSVAKHTPEGLRWDMGDGPSRQYPNSRRAWYPNFAHGTAGIGAYLARLGKATNQDGYVDAARQAASWVLTTCRTDDGTCAAHHHDPAVRRGDFGIGPARHPDDATPIYTMGWCHGPPGLAWFFRELHLATGESRWAELIGGTAKSIRLSGIPERREPGFWDNVGQCCGSAGVAEFFLDLHCWRNIDDDLAFAVELVDDLLARAIADDRGMRWSNVEFRSDPPELPPETTFFQGASGIGTTLVRLSRHLEGDRSSIGWPHAPDWQSPMDTWG
jgi:lantibiotic modifying enzyme